MKEKYIAGFFNTISWGVWAATIAAIVFALVLLFTGMKKPPVFTLNDASLAPAAANDAALAEHGKTGEDWFVLELELTVAAAKHSPFEYTAQSFALAAPAELAEGDWFVTLDAPLDYSKISPDDCLLRLYVRSPGGEEALRARLPELRFTLSELVGRFTFIKYPFKGELPGFSLADFTLPQGLAAA